MSIEYSPVDVACNLKCDYCYENPMRDAGNVATPADWERAKRVLSEQNYKFSLHGGEPLLAPIEHLEEVFAFGLEKFGGNGIQTNGTLLTDEHIELFRRYRVGVGISCDGPGSLSSLRGSNEDAEKTINAIKRLVDAGLIPSLIVTVHKMNGSISTRRAMFRWFDQLEDLSIRHINLHMLETERGMEGLALSEHENIGFFSDAYNYSKKSKIKFLPFEDIRRLLLGQKDTTCIWNGCDPYTTAAVNGVSRSGQRSNCGRMNKDGINWVKADTPGKERYLVLHQTPQEHGGCKDCRFFVFCKGNCPGTAIDGDWRNRTIHCSVWFYLFSAVERDIIGEARFPISRDTRKLSELENHLINIWSGETESSHIDTPHQDWHDDSDASRGVPVTWLNG